MKRLLIYASLAAVLGVAAFEVMAQAPAAQPAKPNADPYANNADAGTLRFPLAAPVGKDSRAIEVAPPNAVNSGAFDAAKWKYGTAFNPPANGKIWNPVKL